MKFKEEEVKVVRVYPVCDCGSEITSDDDYNHVAMLSSPPQYYCECKSCGEKYRLRSDQMSKIEYRRDI